MASQTLVGSPLSIGGGYQVFREWLFIEPDLAVGVIMLLLVVRSLATAFTVYGGGAGGLFVPLVVNGGLVGRAIAEVLHPQQASRDTACHSRQWYSLPNPLAVPSTWCPHFLLL
jgi:H+/Cl- antiporter ClcA